MSASHHAPHRGRTAHGFSMIEVVVATLLLAVCLVPAANALRAGLAMPDIAADASGRLGCVKAAMESVMAESYFKLLAAARARTVATSYSTPAAGNCPAINVYVTRYDPTTPPYYFTSTDTGLLYVQVRLADPVLTGAAAYTLTSLVAL